MTLQQQQQLEERYVMHTFGRKPVDLVEGSGMVVRDDEGKEYLDFIGGIGVISLGHCHPALVEAVTEQAKRLMHVSNYYYIEGRGQLAEKLSNLLNECVPADEAEPWQTFFATSGAEANECAIKLARLHGRCVAQQKGLSSLPRTIVTLERSFHGRTLATLAATGQDVFHKSFRPLPAGFDAVELNDIDALVDALDHPSEATGRVCAVMLECIQGEGGVWPADLDYLRAVRAACDERNILLVVDEVQTGVFRTGAPFSYQRAGIEPDVVSVAKGIAGGFPTGGVAARAEVADLLVLGDHGSTFGGNPLAVACGRACLETLVAEDMGEHVIEAGAHLAARLSELPHVTEVRGAGLMRGAQLDVPVATQLVEQGLERAGNGRRGLVFNHIGDSILRFLPPLVVSGPQIDEMCAALGQMLA